VRYFASVQVANQLTVTSFPIQVFIPQLQGADRVDVVVTVNNYSGGNGSTEWGFRVIYPSGAGYLFYDLGTHLVLSGATTGLMSIMHSSINLYVFGRVSSGTTSVTYSMSAIYYGN